MGEKTKSKSFRVSEERHKELSELEDFSEIFRSMAELYLNEQFFRNGVDVYVEGKVDSFEEYTKAYFETRAENFSTDIVEELDNRVEPEEVVGPLRDYLAALNFGDRIWAEQAADDFYDVSEELGDFFNAYTDRFSDNQWDETLE